ncbi:MAG: ferritin family protein [Sedimentisphaerales bacterium]|nr:ferritin family protein [Sedimentisphaerales bacterium]
MAMEIFAYAIELKQEKEMFYRQLARENKGGIREMFSLLADEEARHRGAIEEMENSVNVKLLDTTIKKDAKRIFEKMRDALGKEEPAFENEQLQLYNKALKYEEKAEVLYLQKSKEATDACQREIFKGIAAQERQHKAVIQAIIDFASRPERWLENAEWYHLDEY